MYIHNLFVRTRYTDFPLLRAEALSHAQETYAHFSSNIDVAERLALLSHACILAPSTQLTENDARMLTETGYLLGGVPTPRDSLTAKGVLAVNMVGSEMNGSDIEFYLREPFVGMTILDMLHTLIESRKAAALKDLDDSFTS